ncbi:hypothetical protein [Fodinibius sediminis]|uniref:hypothetical protein n=1 Tax=Fodinibius sediminis TaxID=1214077 RepID=UPI00163DB2FF|nr:hypothetical protein [Fodinibius sediminis]
MRRDPLAAVPGCYRVAVFEQAMLYDQPLFHPDLDAKEQSNHVSRPEHPGVNEPVTTE